MSLGFWNHLTAIERVFYIMAIPSTFLFIIQTILALLGFDQGDMADRVDTDAGGDVHGMPDDGFQLISIRTLVAFFALFGWTGVVLAKTSLHIAAVIILSGLAGLCGMLAAAGILYAVSRLQEEGNLDIKNVVGKNATVHLTIPEKRGGAGKVHVVVQERLAELLAVTDDDERIPSGAGVLITGTADDSTVIVTKR